VLNIPNFFPYPLLNWKDYWTIVGIFVYLTIVVLVYLSIIGISNWKKRFM